MIAST